MSLSDLNFKLEYRSDTDNLVEDFFIPCLSQSQRYDRAVGYFTSGGLSVAARGIAALIRNGGSMRLVASPVLSEKDIEEIERGYKMRSDVISQALIRELDAITDSEVLENVKKLAWLISIGRLDVKIAFRRNLSGTSAKGIFHEKVGIFSGAENDIVAFSGSPNETASGLVDNFEDINVFTYWSDRERVQNKIRHFEELWRDSVEGLEVIGFPRAAREKLISYKPRAEPTINVEKHDVELPGLRPYQASAVQAWEKSNRVGILAMATATGKTIVALEAVRPLIERGIVTIVIVPSDSLVDQWEKAVLSRYPAATIILCRSGFSTWIGNLRAHLMSNRPSFKEKPLFIIATMATASGEEFLSTILDLGKPEKMAMIIDEVHRAGAATYRKAMDIRCSYRLGLSATPIRQWDTMGTRAIMDYFGGVAFDYTLKEAILDGFLSPYEYHIYPVTMTVDELDAYQELSKSIASKIQELKRSRPDLAALSLPELMSRLEFDGGHGLSEKIKMLLVARRRIIRQASSKATVIAEVAKKIEGKSCLVYCDDFDQIDEVREELFKMKIHPAEYTSRMSREEREATMKALKDRHVDFVLSCRCLDEGVDIPSCDAAILIANSKSTREFIQRRGRLLRLHPGKRHSDIVDLLVIPADSISKPPAIDEVMAGILIGELQRALLFTEDAKNREEALENIKLIAGLFDMKLEDIA